MSRTVDSQLEHMKRVLITQVNSEGSGTSLFAHTIYWPGHAKTCLMPYANNKGADQPAHPRSLISTFIVRCVDRMIYILAISKITRF